MDAFSDGQMASKLWLCEQLEALDEAGKISVGTVWVFGSWYATLPLLLLARGKARITKVVCFDTDPKANRIAEKILNHWICEGMNIHIERMDCAEVLQTGSKFLNELPDIIINTSCEHMNYDWWSQIPAGVKFAAQSTNMVHPTHSNTASTLQDFTSKLQPSEIYYSGEKNFDYPNLKFKRYLLIGKKTEQSAKGEKF